jgi:predicted  nucleic acid-binding Zn-ribbon protein
MTSYAEQARTDPALAAFIAAEVARAGVELAALKVEHEHQREVIAQLQRDLADAKQRAREFELKLEKLRPRKK